MRFLVVGGGSIGTRHMRNLKRLGFDEITVCDTQPARLKQLHDEFGVSTLTDLQAALKVEPTVTFITTPTSQHIPIALAAARVGSHLFIEKPLSHTLEGIDELLEIVRAKNLVSLVGCNMRFHHGPATIKRVLHENVVGPVVTALLDAGQYLPDWHPDRDYRQEYSANRSGGGGVILDGIHEIDYARWLFGEVEEVFCYGGKLSNLEIDTEDCVNILMKFSAGFSAHIHLDYIQRAYSRSCKVIGEEGTIVWDITQGAVRLFSASTKRWNTMEPPDGYDMNQMYMEEVRHFLRCIDGQEESVLDAREAKRVLEVALTVKDSMQSGERRKV